VIWLKTIAFQKNDHEKRNLKLQKIYLYTDDFNNFLKEIDDGGYLESLFMPIHEKVSHFFCFEIEIIRTSWAERDMYKCVSVTRDKDADKKICYVECPEKKEIL